MNLESTNSKNKINWGFYIAFVIATIAITQFFTSHRYFTQGNDLVGYSVVAASLSFFVLSCVYMAFVIYAEEKDNNNLRVSFAPFEAMYKRFKLKAN